MYTIRKGIHIDFAHHVSGHPGACINVHGHTWKFEVELGAVSLNAIGFVTDFKDLKTRVLEPVHLLLDHSFAISTELYLETLPQWEGLGTAFMATRGSAPGPLGYKHIENRNFNGATNRIVGGMKLAVFPFSPTSERLVKWLFEFAEMEMEGDGISVLNAWVYETLHPVESVASFCRD